MPDPVKLQTIVRSAIAATRSTPGRAGRFSSLPADAVEVVVAGDLHGHIANFRTIFRFADADAFLAKVDADRLVTGRIVCDDGFEFASDRHSIVDGSHSPSGYAPIPTDRLSSDSEFRACVRMV